MTVQTAHPTHRFNTKTTAAALAGAVLAVSAGYTAALFVLDEAPASISEPADIGIVGNSNVQPELFPGTNREERSLMHRR